MPEKCSICSHPEVKIIDARLGKNDASLPALAARFTVSTDALARHRENHLRSSVRGSERFGDSADSIIDDLVRLKKIAEIRLASVEDGKSTAVLIREIRGIDEAVAKIGGLQRRGHEGCMSRFAWERFVAALQIIVSTHPEIREEILRALEALEE